MANKNYTQYILLAAIAVFIIVGIANYGSPSGYSPLKAAQSTSRYDVKEYVCEWDNGWKWIGDTSTNTYKLGHSLSRTEAYCNNAAWTCIDVAGNSIITVTGTADCDVHTEGAKCFCRR